MHEHGASLQTKSHALTADNGFPMKWKLNVRPRWFECRVKDSGLEVGVVRCQATETGSQMSERPAKPVTRLLTNVREL